MVLHLRKLSVGSTSFEQLEAWQRSRDSAPFHDTRHMPRRREELLAGGSVYWIIRGSYAARQLIVGLEPVLEAAGDRWCCRICLAPELVRVTSWPHRPFQGWRYLTSADAPPDCASTPFLQELVEAGFY